MKFLFSALALLFFTFADGQNLIDGEFLEYQCAGGRTNSLARAIPTLDRNCLLLRWQFPGGASPQLMPYQGDTLLHINLGTETFVDDQIEIHREYAQALFKDTLEQDIWYRFSADIIAHPEATTGIVDFDVYFGSQPITTQLSPYQALALNPQIVGDGELPSFNQFDYFNEWRQFEAYYRADGTETYL